MNSLPIDLFNKIMLFNSHPLADIVKDSLEFKYRFLLSDKPSNESPFCRGMFNGHFKRKEKPHKLDMDGDRVYTLTKEEEYEYWIGYDHEYKHSLFCS